MSAPARATKSIITTTLSPEERIRRRAYELYVLRGAQSGSELEDWLQAEKEFLLNEASPIARQSPLLSSHTLRRLPRDARQGATA